MHSQEAHQGPYQDKACSKRDRVKIKIMTWKYEDQELRLGFLWRLGQIHLSYFCAQFSFL